MKSSERLAAVLGPVLQKRFNLASMPIVRIQTGAGLGNGVRFRAYWSPSSVHAASATALVMAVCFSQIAQNAGANTVDSGLRGLWVSWFIVLSTSSVVLIISVAFGK